MHIQSLLSGYAPGQESSDVWSEFGETTICYCEGIEYFISNMFRTLQTVP